MDEMERAIGGKSGLSSRALKNRGYSSPSGGERIWDIFFLEKNHRKGGKKDNEKDFDVRKMRHKSSSP